MDFWILCTCIYVSKYCTIKTTGLPVQMVGYGLGPEGTASPFLEKCDCHGIVTLLFFNV